jgi:hypothetical protein
MKHQQERAKREVVEHGTQQSESHHELSNDFDIPSPWMVHHLVVYVIACDRHLREIGQEIGEQDLFWKQWKELDEQRYPSHAEHVSEVCACSHEDVFQCVRKSHSPLAHASHKNAQILFKQDDIRRFLRNIDGTIDGNSDVRGMKG